MRVVAHGRGARAFASRRPGGAARAGSRILLRVRAPLDRLAPVADARPAAVVVVETLGLGAGAATRDGRPRVAAAMIASADGRAAVAGTPVDLGRPADTALVRELRTTVGAILVGTGTLRAEGDAHLLDGELIVALAPVLAGGDAPTLLAGGPLDPPGRLVLRDVHRAGQHLLMHYTAAA